MSSKLRCDACVFTGRLPGTFCLYTGSIASASYAQSVGLSSVKSLNNKIFGGPCSEMTFVRRCILCRPTTLLHTSLACACLSRTHLGLRRWTLRLSPQLTSQRSGTQRGLRRPCMLPSSGTLHTMVSHSLWHLPHSEAHIQEATAFA